MKRLFILTCLSSAILAACNGNNSNSTASTDSTTTTNQSSTAENTAATSTPNSTNTSGSFKEVMDKMMSNMQSMQMTGDPDHDFASMMKMHHQGAIDMSNIELAKGTNVALKQVAQQTIDDSQKDNNDLTAFMGSHQPSKKSDYGQKQMDKMKGMNMNMNMSGDIDKDFAMMMSMHHQEGIDMAKDYLKVGSAEETKKVANSTIKSNTEGIKKLKAAAGGADMSNMKGMKGMEDMKGMDMDKSDKNNSKTDTGTTAHSHH